MTDQPMQCERCGKPHAGQSKTTAPGCRAHRRDGSPCGNDAMRGQKVCRMHGGKSIGAEAAAEQRQAEAAAEATVRKLWAGLDQVEPVKDPIGSLERLAGALEQLVDEAGARVTELKNVAGGEHLTQLRAEVVLFERALGHLRQLLVDMARLGIATRAVEVQQGQADQMLGWLRSGLEAGAAAGIEQALLQVVLDAFLGAMRRSRAGAAVAELGSGAAS